MKHALTVIILAFIPMILFSQSTIEKSKKYSYAYDFEGHAYKLKELDSVMMQSKTSHELYTKGIAKHNSSKNYAKVGLVLIGSGLLSITIAANFNYGDYIAFPILIYGLFSVPSGIIIELIALGKSLNSQGYLKQAINHFNWEKSQGIIYVEEQPHLDIGISNNGIGLFYTF